MPHEVNGGRDRRNSHQRRPFRLTHAVSDASPEITRKTPAEILRFVANERRHVELQALSGRGAIPSAQYLAWLSEIEATALADAGRLFP